MEEQLEGYEPVAESLQKLRDDPAIQPEHKKQAQRMMRQRIRLRQTVELLTTDKGVDISTNAPLRMNHDVIQEEWYRTPFVQGCEAALGSGVAAFRVNHCLHFGVSCRGNTPAERRMNALRAASFGLLESVKEARDRLAHHYADVNAIREKEAFDPILPIDLINNHLRAVPANSIFTWNLPYGVLWPIVRDELSVVCIFDLAGFFFAAEEAGLMASLSSRKDAERLFSLQGRSAALSFAGRVIKIVHPELKRESLLMTGAVSRFINNLHSPLSFLIGMKEHWIDFPEGDEELSKEEHKAAK